MPPLIPSSPTLFRHILRKTHLPNIILTTGTTTTTTTAHPQTPRHAVIINSLPFSSQTTTKPTPKPTLSDIKAAGLARLRSTTTLMLSKSSKPLNLQSRNPLSDDNNPKQQQTNPLRRFKAGEGTNEPSVAQLRVAALTQKVLISTLDEFSRKSAMFNLKGEPIDITDVEVSPDLRHARVFWSLPDILSNDVSQSDREEISRRMQERLDKHGGQLKALVGAKMGSTRRNVPVLRFVAELSKRYKNDISREDYELAQLLQEIEEDMAKR